MSECQHILTRIRNDYLEPLFKVSQNASEYLSDSASLKTPLGDAVEGLEDNVRLLAVSFEELRSKFRELKDDLYSLKIAYGKSWEGIINEEATKQVYEHIYNDSQTFLNDENRYAYLIKVFAHLLHVDSAQLRAFTREEIVAKINGDVYVKSLAQEIERLNTFFEGVTNNVNMGEAMGDKDEKLVSSFTKLKTSLQKFNQGNLVNTDFYRENFMRLDVFMQELSYEEITQQRAYELPRLLGDIGGSMGLFIGGSVLSIFEFADVFLHNGARMLLNK